MSIYYFVKFQTMFICNSKNLFSNMAFDSNANLKNALFFLSKLYQISSDPAVTVSVPENIYTEVGVARLALNLCKLQRALLLLFESFPGLCTKTPVLLHFKMGGSGVTILASLGYLVKKYYIFIRLDLSISCLRYNVP